jgi:hypothetical protein
MISLRPAHNADLSAWLWPFATPFCGLQEREQLHRLFDAHGNTDARGGSLVRNQKLHCDRHNIGSFVSKIVTPSTTGSSCGPGLVTISTPSSAIDLSIGQRDSPMVAPARRGVDLRPAEVLSCEQSGSSESA